MKFWLLGLLALMTVQARAQDDAAAMLIAQLAQIEQLRGQFIQHQYDEQGEPLSESTGQFSLLRPGYFSWDIQSPDSQLVIATPDYLWHYDRDLDTATRRNVGASPAVSPLQLLGGDTSALAEHYHIESVADGAFRLTPLDATSSFQHLTLHLSAAGQLQAMDFIDALNQRLAVEFSGLDTTTPLSAADFAFEPPPEADLFIHDQ